MGWLFMPDDIFLAQTVSFKRKSIFIKKIFAAGLKWSKSFIYCKVFKWFDESFKKACMR